MPLLSILVPTFNRSGYLRECLDSLLATTVDCEIIVGDNASEDDTTAVVASYGDPRIRYHRHVENLGAIANFNFLLGQVTGSYVCFFGDDDKALAGCFEPKVGLLETHPHIDLVYSTASGMDSAGQSVAVGNTLGRLDHGYLGGRDEFQDLFVNCYISWQTLVFRRRLLDEVGDLADGWGLNASHDWFWLQMMVRGRQTAYIPDATVCIRFHAESFSTKEAKVKGYFGSDRRMIWQNWLLEHPDPPVVPEAIWQRMAQVVRLDVHDMYGDVPARVDLSLRWLAELKVAYRQRMNDRLRDALRRGDPYQPDAPKWPIDADGRRAFVYRPTWQEDTWRQVLATYGTAFGPADPVTLVIALDPRQGLTAEQAHQAVMAHLTALGVTDPPDMLLVPEPVEDADFAGLYAAADVVVAVGDRLAATRAERMGRPALVDLTQASWRGAAGLA